MLKSLTVLSLAVSLAIPAFAVSQEVSASPKSVPEQIVDSMNGIFGVHPGMRSNHAKGVVLEGTFAPSPSAASISTAAHLQKQTSPLPTTIRFSDATGVPAIPDTDPGSRPHGIAMKIQLPDGLKTDIVAISYNGFPAATAEEFRDMFIAIGTTKPEDPHPTAIEKFLDTHPAAKNFVTAPKPPPVSYGTLAYFGVNSFKFTDGNGVATFGRYQIQPVAGEQFLAPDQVSTKGPNYLTDEIRERVSHGPVQFKLLLQIAESGDKIDNPSIAWPDTRKKVELGTITITKAVPDSQAAEKKLLFQPSAVVPGIEPADPMIAARAAAYAISLGRRSK